MIPRPIFICPKAFYYLRITTFLPAAAKERHVLGNLEFCI